MGDLLVPAKKKILAPDGKDAKKALPPEWWDDFPSHKPIQTTISGSRFGVASVAKNGLQLVPLWEKETAVGTLHQINGHWFKIVQVAHGRGLLLEYRGPIKKQKKGKA